MAKEIMNGNKVTNATKFTNLMVNDFKSSYSEFKNYDENEYNEFIKALKKRGKTTADVTADDICEIADELKTPGLLNTAKVIKEEKRVEEVNEQRKNTLKKLDDMVYAINSDIGYINELTDKVNTLNAAYDRIHESLLKLEIANLNRYKKFIDREAINPRFTYTYFGEEPLVRLYLSYDDSSGDQDCTEEYKELQDRLNVLYKQLEDCDKEV